MCVCILTVSFAPVGDSTCRQGNEGLSLFLGHEGAENLDGAQAALPT